MMQLIQEAQYQSGNAELAGQTLGYFRMCKEIEAKMRKQPEK